MDILHPGRIDVNSHYEVNYFDRLARNDTYLRSFNSNSDLSGLRYRGHQSSLLQETSFNENSYQNSNPIETRIQIDPPAVSESTPLLQGGSAAAGTGGVGLGSGGISGLSAGVGAGIGAGYIAGGLAAGIYKAVTGGRGNPDESAVLAGHHFIGPGNEVKFAPPVNEADAVAKEHDIAYSNAKTVEDVRIADDVAISAFLAAGGVSGVIGAVGLKVKQGVEKITGHLYPPLPGT